MPSPTASLRTRLPKPTLLACALASCLLLAAPVALAQSTAATLRGHAANGATITATNTETGFSRSVTADASGNYVLSGLPPGTYKVDVSSGGSRTMVLQVGQVATVDLSAQPTAIAGVTVHANVLPETKTSEVATYVTPEQIAALPQGSRNFLAFADTVPGMNFSTTSDGRSTKLRGGGQSSNGINVFIDGVGQKNYVLKGGITGQDSSRGNPFPQLGIAEYKVITSNYKAEFDQLSSAAVVAVTKGGTNEFHGQVFYDYSGQDWVARTPSQKASGSQDETYYRQYGASFGGAFIRDVAHYFFTWEHKSIATPASFNPNFFAVDDLPPQFQDLANQTTSSPFDEDLFFGKVDWKLNDDHLLELTAKYRTEDEITGVGGVNTAEHGTTKEGDETRVDLRWQWTQADWLNDAHLTYEDASFGPRPTNLENGYVLTMPDQQLILNAGGGRDFQDKGQKGWSLQDDFTFYGWDNHTVKVGAKIKWVQINAFEQQPYNPQFFYDVTQNLDIPYKVQFGANTMPGIDRDIESHNRQFGIYIQDDWDVSDKLQVNLGIRWDYEVTPGYLDYETPANLVAALQGWANVHGPNVDYDINDYISTGNNRDAFSGAWAPRLGFSYDLFGDQRHVIFGGAGRSYDRNLWDYLALEQSKSTFPSYEFRFNTAGHPCTVGVNNCLAWDPAYFDQDNLAELVAANPFLGAEVNLMNNNLDTPYSDQFSLGMRNAFGWWGADWNSSVTYMHVRSYDGLVFSLGNRFPDGSFRDPACGDATWGCQPWGFPIPGFGTFIKVDNGIETKLDSLLVSLEKPYGNGWGMTFAYTYSDAHENRNNAYESDEHYLFDYPTPDEEGFHRTLGLAKHRLVVTGVLDGWYGSLFSAKLALASPRPKESLNCHDFGFSHCFWDPYTPRQFIGDKQLDLAVEKRWALSEDMGIKLRLDVLNAFNWNNWTDYDTWHGGPGPAPFGLNPHFGERSGLGTAYPSRMFKLTGSFDW